MDEELSEADDPGLRVLLLRHLVYRRAGDAGRLGPGAADRERLGRKRTLRLSSLAVPGWDRGADPAAVPLHLLEEPAPGEHRYGAGGGPAHGAGECAEAGVPRVLRKEQPGGHPRKSSHPGKTVQGRPALRLSAPRLSAPSSVHHQSGPFARTGSEALRRTPPAPSAG